MAISYRTGSTATTGGSTATSLNLTLPATLAAGDKVIITASAVVLSANQPSLTATSTATAPTALTVPGATGGTESGAGENTGTWTLTAGSSDAGATVTITPKVGGSAVSAFISAACAAYPGANLPVDVADAAFGGANTASVTCPSKTTTVTGDWAVYILGGAAEGASAITMPAGSTTRQNETPSSRVVSVICDSNGSAGSAGASIGGGTFITDSASSSIMTAFTIGLPPVSAAGPSIATSALTGGVQNVAYKRWLIATAGTAPYTWSITSGTLPAGLTLNSNGTISGTPTGTGTSSFTVQVSDAASLTAQSSLSITVISAPLSPALGSTDANGVQTWNFTSSAYAGGSTIRVLAPSSPSGSWPHGFLFTLPVSAGADSTTFGNGLDTVRLAGLHNTYNLTVVEVDSNAEWFADNNNGADLLETFMLQLAAWAAAQFGTGAEKNYLAGLSRSGIGGQAMFFHWPNIWQAVASWDYPAAMTAYDGTDPHGTVGGSPAASYGYADNFTANYQLSAANLAKWSAGQNFGTVKRVWIGGYFTFQLDVADGDAALTAAGILHDYAAVAVNEHNWSPTPAWIGTALASILEPKPASASRAVTAGITAAARASLTAGTTRPVTAGRAAHAVPVRPRGAASTFAATMSASATAVRHRSASRATAAAVTAAGGHSAATHSGGTRPAVAVAISAVATAIRRRISGRAVGAGIAASAGVARHRSASLAVTAAPTAAGAVPGGPRSAARPITATVTAETAHATSRAAAAPLTATIRASVIRTAAAATAGPGSARAGQMTVPRAVAGQWN